MNGAGGEGGIGHLEERYAFLQRTFDVGADFGIGYYPSISVGQFTSFPSSFYELPSILPGSGTGEEEHDDSATPGAYALPPQMVDPEQGPLSTVFEGASTSAPTATRTRETDWDWVYDRYVVLNEPEVEEDVPFHSTIIDWGATVIGGVFDPTGIGDWVRDQYLPAAAATTGVTGLPSLGQQTMLAGPPATIGAAAVNGGCPPHGPKYAKICLATREITPLRRRRRRRLLTSSDIKDLSALKSIVGGAALQAAVVQAVRR